MSESEQFKKGFDELAELERKLKSRVDIGATVDKNAVDAAESKRTVVKDTMGGDGQPAFELTDGDATVAVSKTGKARMDAELIAEKPKQSRIESQTVGEKRIPKDGETISLSQLLSDYKTPFSDAYEHSKKLKPGEPGKSPTLEGIVDRLKNCPWTQRIHIHFDSKTENPEYSNADSTITISLAQPPWQQVLSFAHEGFHATHQGLIPLWIDGPAKNAHDFASIRGQLEVGSFESEIKVYLEIAKFMQGAEPVGFNWRNQHGVVQPEKNLVALYLSGGRSALEKFVLDEAFVRTKEQTENHTYRQYYESGYKKYLTTFENDRKSLVKLYPEHVIRDGRY